MVLQLLALGIKDVLTFDFMASPPREALLGAVEQLYFLGAVEEASAADEEEEGEGEGRKVSKKDGTKEEEEEEESYNLQLTPLGQTLANFPLDPPLSRAIVTSPQHGCTHEVVSVVAMLSVDSVVFTPQNKREQAVAAHRKFSATADGDHVTLLNIYRAYKGAKGNKVDRVCVCDDLYLSLSSSSLLFPLYLPPFFPSSSISLPSLSPSPLSLSPSFSPILFSPSLLPPLISPLSLSLFLPPPPPLQAWCRENFIHTRNMKTVMDTRRQLSELCERVGVAMASGGAECGLALRHALLGGLFLNVAEHMGEGKYKTVRERERES